MKQLTCEMCGSAELIKQEGVFVCQTCGCKYSVEEAKKIMVEGTVDVKIDKEEDVKNYLIRLFDLFEEKAFDDSIAYCDKILAIDANDINAIVLKKLAEEKISVHELMEDYDWLHCEILSLPNYEKRKKNCNT